MTDEHDGTTDGMAYVTIREATAYTGVPGRTIRSWVARGKIAALPSARGKMVSTSDVTRMAQLSGVGKPRATVTQMAREGQNDAMPRATGDATWHDSGTALIAHFDGVYRDLLAEKDARIHDLQERVDRAEAEVAMLRKDRATVPLLETASVPEDVSRRSWWRRLLGSSG